MKKDTTRKTMDFSNKLIEEVEKSDLGDIVTTFTSKIHFLVYKGLQHLKENKLK